MAGAALQTRPEPMNASPYHSKVRVTLKFADAQFAAGGMVSGKVELECKAEKGLGIGVIMVELVAIEELTSRDHSATSTFLHSKRFFQGPGLPPSNSVHPYPEPGDPPLPSNYYHARRGVTTFFFQFPLPESSPSSIEFGSGLARLRYEVRASVGVAWKGEKKLVTDKKQVDVVERFELDFNRVEPEGVIVSENGKIWVQAKVLGGFMVAGEPACIELQVKNHSSKKNSGLFVTLTRELYLPNIPPSQKQPLQLSDTITSVSFRGPEYTIQPGAEGVANLVVDVPKQARSVKGGPRQGKGPQTTECLFEVRCAVGIKLAMGIGSKDIRLDLPVTILHPSVVPDLPPPNMYPVPPAYKGEHAYDPTSGILYEPFMSSASYLDRPVSPYAYPVPPMSPPIVPYIQHGQVWLPPPPMPFLANGYAPSYYGPPGSQHVLMPPFMPPPRPSSAEPKPSQPLYDITSGIADVVAPPPLIPIPTGGMNDGEREKGKGERASRIAHHLRMSSRHRSASPPSHRYHIVEGNPGYPTMTLAAIPRAVTEAGAENPSSSPSSSPELHTRKGLALSPLLTGGEVVSPRPMLSPKLSFSKDPFEQVTQVENLERIAAEERKQVSSEPAATSPLLLPPALSERSHSGKSRDKDKTLPRPPVPSGKEKNLNASISRARADSLFPPELLEAGIDETPPTPTLAAVTSLKVPRGLRLGDEASGLDALEARLLAEVGTRKPEKERAPDVRTVLPITIPRPTDAEPPVDSAISSLTLPGLDIDADEKTLKRGGISRGGGSDRETDLGGVGGSSAQARDSKETARGRDSKETKKGGSSRAKKKGDKHSSKHNAVEGSSSNKDKELHKLRKAAQGRITAWLGNIDPEVPPQSLTPPVETPPPASPSPRRGRSPGVVATSPVHNPARTPVTRSPAVSPVRSMKVTPEIPETPLPQTDVGPSSGEPSAPTKPDINEAEAAPNPRSSGFVAIGTVRAPVTGAGKSPTPFFPKASPRLAVYPPRPLDSEVKYDIRSARGGKGGIVTSVAAIWASASQSTGNEAQAKPKPQSQPKPQANSANLAAQWARSEGAPKPSPKPKPNGLKSPAVLAGDGRPKAMRPAAKAMHLSPTVTSPAAEPMITLVTDLTAKRARLIKSTSVPAVVSSSTATPMLSSTASLARPSPLRADREKPNMKVPPTISEAEPRVEEGSSAQTSAATAATTRPAEAKSPASPPAKDYAFGQARLRELIKRYQGQISS